MNSQRKTGSIASNSPMLCHIMLEPSVLYITTARRP